MKETSNSKNEKLTPVKEADTKPVESTSTTATPPKTADDANPKPAQKNNHLWTILAVFFFMTSVGLAGYVVYSFYYGNDRADDKDISDDSDSNDTSDSEQQTCSFESTEYKVGQCFTNDCNTCCCSADGEIACTEMACDVDDTDDTDSDSNTDSSDDSDSDQSQYDEVISDDTVEVPSLWDTYVNDSWNVILKYPKGLEVEENPQASGGVYVRFHVGATTVFWVYITPKSGDNEVIDTVESFMANVCTNSLEPSQALINGQVYEKAQETLLSGCSSEDPAVGYGKPLEDPNIHFVVVNYGLMDDQLEQVLASMNF